MTIALLLIPQATSEVWERHWRTVVVKRDGTQLGDGTPLCQVIHIHVEWQTVLQAVDETGTHDEVHAAMTAHLLGELAKLLEYRTLIFLLQSLALLIWHKAMSR